MAGGFPLGPDICNASGTVLGGVTVTSGSSANTKGAWTQLIASTANDFCDLIVWAVYAAGVNRTIAIDIGIGSSGNEVVIISDLVIAAAGGTNGAYTLFQTPMLPICIPAGTRISARVQSTASSDSGDSISLIGFDGAFTQLEGCAGVDAIGWNSSTTFGTTVTPANGSYGSYAQLTASTARDYVGFFYAIDNLNATGTGYTYYLDIAIGASGSEKVLLPAITMKQDNANIHPCMSPLFPIGIPAGTRIAARSQANGTTAFGLTLYGVYQ